MATNVISLKNNAGAKNQALFSPKIPELLCNFSEKILDLAPVQMM